ncbi:dehydratase [Thermocladium modestius]|uniref:Dehydratase n=1 Tax=Thermocladium modestius TaxID=62609 RepID=A0A830GTL1_9CREN|nr:mandelate racemase/muconate lactonizing enzyme family protein [Thermocladium modestius]GGP19560.1 dehydratase [Thermocladium modestius]
MKITKIDTFLVSAVWRNFVIVRLETDEGVVGYGEGTMGDFEKTIAAAVNDFAPFLIGREIEINKITNFLNRNFFWRHGPILSTAISAIEQAMWDAVGKSLKKPVYELLGGRSIDRLRVYANGFISGAQEPEKFAEAAVDVVKQGFTALKFDPFGAAGPTISSEDFKAAIKRIEAVRNAVGDNVDIMIEAHGRFNVRTAINIAHAIEEFNPFWLEEPVPEENIISMREVKQASRVPIATGERLTSVGRFWDLLSSNAADIIQPDVCHVGGIRAFSHVAAMADVNNVAVAPHNPNGPIATAASINALSTVPNALILEYWLDAQTVRRSLVKEYFDISDGYLHPSSKPGLGIEVNEEALTKYQYKKMHLEYFSSDYKYYGDTA